MATESTQESTVIAVPVSGDYRVDVLLDGPGIRWNAPGALGSPVTVTFSFAETNGYFTGIDANGFVPFTSEQRKAAREVLALISSQFNITFSEITETTATNTPFGQMRFANNTQLASGGYAYFPPVEGDGGTFNGDNFINNATQYLTGYSHGTFNWKLMIHEILHGLGIKHPGNYNAGEPPSNTPGNYLVKTEDNQINSIMSYIGNSQGLQRIDLGLYDMLAMTYLYGAKAFRVESDQYVFSNSASNAIAAASASTLKNTVVLMPDTGCFLQLVNDTGGDNIFDFRAMTASVKVDLGQGKSSSAGCLPDGETAAIDNIQIGFGTTINTAYGSNFDDLLVGNLGANWIEGGDGNDTINGGSGNDTLDGGNGSDVAVFSGKFTDYRIRFDSNAGFYTVTDEVGSGGTDTLRNIEFAQFTDKVVSVSSLILTPPVIALTSTRTLLGIGATAVLTFTLSDPSTNFIATDVTVSGGTLSNFTGSGTSYAATFTPAANSTANAVVSVASGVFTDAAGNANADGSDANNTVTFSVDTLIPTIAVSSAKSSLIAGDTATLTFTLSEPSTNFVASDVTVSGGTLTGFAGSGTTYTATLTPTANSTTSAVVGIASGVFTDAAGNANADGSDANNTVTFSVDTLIPTIAVSSTKSSLIAGDTATLTFTLSEASTNFVASDVTVSGGTLTGFAGSGTSYTATFTPTANSNANGVVSVASGVFTDAAGNANADGSDANNTVTFSVDTLIPTIAVSSTKSSLIAGDTATLTFTLSEPSTNFVASDVTVSGGTLTGFTGSGTSYTATLTPTANSTTSAVVSVASGVFTDAAGNANVDGSDANNRVTFLVNTVLGQSYVGTAANDTLSGGAGNDTIDGGAGTDTVQFQGKLSAYKVTMSGANGTVADSVTARDGMDTLKNIEHLRFTDFDINTAIKALAGSMNTATVQRVMELYVAFFNRTPDADGLTYWLGQSKAGVSTTQIAESFYGVGVQYTSLTGFSSTMTTTDFINVVYRNVLGRADGADAGGLQYWTEKLTSGKETRGSLVSTILDAAHTYKGDATYGWVANLLDNKITVATKVAIDWGLNYLTADASVTNGMAIAKAVTPTDITAAIVLVGVPEGAVVLG